MTKIGIIGPAGAGKDTFAELLCESLGPDDTRIDSFAAPMRQIASGLSLRWYVRDEKERAAVKSYYDFGGSLQHEIEEALGYLRDDDMADLYAFTIDLLRDHKLLWCGLTDTLYCSPRQFLQLLGTAGRKVRPSFWNDALLARTAGYPEKYLILSDVRFPDENDMLDYSVALHRLGYHWHPEKHVSEQHGAQLQKQPDFRVTNHGTLADLRVSAQLLANHIKEQA